MNQSEQAPHQNESETATSFGLEKMTAHQILDRFEDVVAAWMDHPDWTDEEFEVMFPESEYPYNANTTVPDTPEALAYDAFRNEAKELVAHDAERAKEVMDAIDEIPDTPRGFTDMMLAGNLAVELTRHDPERGRAIWLRGLLSEHAEHYLPASRTLVGAIRHQSLPPDVLADVVARFDTYVNQVVKLVPEARDKFAWLTASGRRTS